MRGRIVDIFPDGQRCDAAVDNEGTAEIVAERQATSSLLDSVLRLYREDVTGDGTVRTLLAQNDDFFSSDAYIELDLTAGVYYIGVSSVGNEKYDPKRPSGAEDAKTALARYRGKACAVEYAEAVKSFEPYATEIL